MSSRRSRAKRDGIDFEQAEYLRSTITACQICGEQKRRLVVDHDHETGRIRGILCDRCNMSIQPFENRATMAALQGYLGLFPMEEGFSYDDVLLRPSLGVVSSRDDISTTTRLGNYEFSIPVVSSPMESVTEYDMALAVHSAGGLGVVHRFMSIESQSELVEKLPRPRAVAVGLKDGLERSDIDGEIIVLDVAHAHSKIALDLVSHIRNRHPNKTIVVGSIATRDGAAAAIDAGADVIRCGIGGGAACSTRITTGVGVPNLTAILECSYEAHRRGKQVVADGGVKNFADVAKAIGAGADAVMLGRLLAGATEAPLRGRYFGQASEDSSSSSQYVEGVTGTVDDDGPVGVILSKMMASLRSSISYCGGNDIETFRDSVELIKVTQNSILESSTRVQHDGNH